MGNLASKLKSLITKALESFGNKEARIVLIGLDAAGKTSMLYKIKLDEEVVTIPTIGFNVETIQYKYITFQVWDIGGQKQIRSLWHNYYRNADAVIFVIDSNDTERMEEAEEEMTAVLKNEHLQDAKILIFANKQDLPHALSPDDIVKKMKLKSAKQDFFVQPSVATTGEGLFEGLDWLSSKL